MATEAAVPDDAGVLAPGRRPLTIGLVLLITAIAFEALAVSTAMPVVSRELNGVRLYGLAFSGFMLANLVGIALGGPLSDRTGPGRPMVVGLTLFGTGLVVSGLAPTMDVVVVGRVVSGLGSGAVFSTAYVVIGLGYPESARPRMFAVISSAWVVPSLVGPVIAGSVADHWTWRAVFLGLAPVMALDAALVLPGMRKLVVPARAHEPLPVANAVGLALGAGVMVAGFNRFSGNVLLASALVVVGLAAAVRPFRRLVPPGTLRARGTLPTAVAMRGLLAFSFFTFDAFLPLTLTSLRGVSPTQAGLTLTAGGISWATGAWVAERRALVWGWRRTVSTGVCSILLGIGTSALVLVPSVPVLLAPLGWLLAGLGMGLCYPTFGLIVLEEAAEGQIGRASSALQLTDMLGVAVGTGVAGAAVAFTVAGGWGRRPGIEAADAMTVVAGLLALLLARRLPHGRGGSRPLSDD